MKTTSFSQHLCSYLDEYLPNVRNYSINTILSYQDSFRLLEEFMFQKHHIKPYLLDYKHFSEKIVLEFLDWLESERKCSPATCNQRLSALSAFFKYASLRGISALKICTDITKIPPKRAPRKPFAYFSVEEVAVLFQMPSQHKPIERRDLVLLCLLYDSGARAKELCDMTIGDVHFSKQCHVTLHGKGKKDRSVPLMGGSSKLLKQYIASRVKDSAGKDDPLFLSQRGGGITPACIRTLIQKYVDRARMKRQDLFQETAYSPHSMRHSKAVHLLEAGVEMVYIRDFLGHSSVQTTEIYATVSQALLNKTLRNRKVPKLDVNMGDRISDDMIPDYLKKKR